MKENVFGSSPVELFSRQPELRGRSRGILEKVRFRAHFLLWQKQKLDGYNFMLEIACYDFATHRRRITVESGNPSPGTDSAKSPGTHPPPAVNPPTMEGLFKMIRNFLGQPECEVRVNYHPYLGYPQKIEIRHPAPYSGANTRMAVTELVPRYPVQAPA